MADNKEQFVGQTLPEIQAWAETQDYTDERGSSWTANRNRPRFFVRKGKNKVHLAHIRVNQYQPYRNPWSVDRARDWLRDIRIETSCTADVSGAVAISQEEVDKLDNKHRCATCFGFRRAKASPKEARPSLPEDWGELRKDAVLSDEKEIALDALAMEGEKPITGFVACKVPDPDPNKKHWLDMTNRWDPWQTLASATVFSSAGALIGSASNRVPASHDEYWYQAVLLLPTGKTHSHVIKSRRARKKKAEKAAAMRSPVPD